MNCSDEPMNSTALTPEKVICAKFEDDDKGQGPKNSLENQQ